MHRRLSSPAACMVAPCIVVAAGHGTPLAVAQRLTSSVTPMVAVRPGDGS